MIKPFKPYIFAGTLIIILLGFLQCTTVSNKTSSKTTEIHDNLSFKTLVSLQKVQKLPHLDSSNLDAPKHQFLLSKRWIKKLNLAKVDESMQTADTVSIMHRLPISNSFITLVITHQSNDNELFTNLVNYTKQGELIDFVPIAYDEIAESCHRTSALVKPYKITVYTTDYCYANKTDTLHYNIDKHGEILRLAN